MHKSISLAEYVEKKNGVPLGASGSMGNMLKRSLGANSFHLFWRNWNPIWGYFLSRNVMRPAYRYLPLWLAVMVTFVVSGALHDVAISLAKLKVTFLFTPWFLLMSLIVLTTKQFDISYQKFQWGIRATINLTIILVCLVTVIAVQKIYV